MNYPKSLESISKSTGRSKIENWLKKHFLEFFNYLNANYPDELPLKEKLYWFYHKKTEYTCCPICGKHTKFINNSRGYSVHCSCKCTQLDKDVRKKNIETNIKLYGQDFKNKQYEKGKQTKLEKYGDANYNNLEKHKKTCLEKYGVENPMQCKEIQQKAEKTCLERYGAKSYITSDEYLSKKEENVKRCKQNCLAKYGVESPMQLESIKAKVQKTCLERYGVNWNCQRKEAHNSRNTHSIKNEEFAKLLDNYNINYEREFTIGKYSFDFKIGDTLVEINPSATHNTIFNPFSKTKIINEEYHKNKTLLAESNGYFCIHVWDWDDIEKIANKFKDKIPIGARECEIKLLNKKETNNFLNKYHFQNTCKNQKVSLGLIYNGEIVEVITFGKPRYNKNYQWELLRLCTCDNYTIIGGTKKLFNFFIKEYKPESIISYCDNSKFSGNIYKQLGFNILRVSKPAKHWYKLKEHKHYTNNMVLKLGVDNLLNTNYGKGANNEELLLKHRFVTIYDCGQTSYEIKFNNDKTNNN